LFSGKGKVREKNYFESMNVGMFNRFCPILKVRAQLEERIDMNKFNRNRERFVIPMHRKNFWTNKWMHEP
jgi:hypothetical protein